MPYTTEYAPAEIYLEYNGVTIYHVYKGNNFEDGARDFWFDNKEDSDDDEGFDVRDLAIKLREPGEPKNYDELDAWRKDIIRKAIDAGLIEAGEDED